MILRINELKLCPDHTQRELAREIQKVLRLHGEMPDYEIVRRSIDARKKAGAEICLHGGRHGGASARGAEANPQQQGHACGKEGVCVPLLWKIYEKFPHAKIFHAKLSGEPDFAARRDAQSAKEAVYALLNRPIDTERKKRSIFLGRKINKKLGKF